MKQLTALRTHGTLRAGAVGRGRCRGSRGRWLGRAWSRASSHWAPASASPSPRSVARSAQGRVGGAAMESIGRNPNSADKIFTPLILSLALIEALGIYAPDHRLHPRGQGLGKTAPRLRRLAISERQGPSIPCLFLFLHSPKARFRLSGESRNPGKAAAGRGNPQGMSHRVQPDARVLQDVRHGFRACRVSRRRFRGCRCSPAP